MANEAESLGSLGEGGMSPDPEKIIEIGKEALGSLDNADPTMNGELGSNNVSDTGGDSIPQGTAGLSNKALDPEAGAAHGIEAQPVSGAPYSGGVDTAPSSSLPSGGETLKNLAAKGVAHTVNAGQTTVGLGIHGVQSAINGFGAIGSSISGAAGGAISATTASVGTAVLTAGGLTVLISQLLGGPDPSAFDANMNTSSCGQNVANAVNAANSDDSGSAVSGAQASAAEEDVAKKIYSILSVYGLKKEAIAGVLGNLQWESGGLDPTIVENFPTTYAISDAKKQAAQDPNNGIGLMQWTFSRNTLLRNYATSKHKDWWDVGLQLDFMMNGDDPSNKPALAAAEATGSPADAAAAYMNTAEHPDAQLAHLSDRQSFAEQWFAKMGSWTVDKSYGQSVIGQASLGSSNASQDAVSTQLASCESSAGVNADNSSVVKAELSYAWPFRHQSIEDFSKGENNRGTPLYQELHKAIWGSNDYESNPLSSCDNGVSTAIQWSGTDKDYKEQAVADQIQYLHTGGGKANGWVQIQWGQDVKKLQPGDVFIAEDEPTVSHTFMYLGTQAPLEYYHNDQSKFEPGADAVSASHDPTTSQSEYNRSPGLNNAFQGGTNASGFGNIGLYEVWRHTGAPSGSKWTSFKPSAAVSS